MDYLLGIDTSTTATKALLIDTDGAVVAVASAGYGFETPRPGWTEQSPALFWDATVKSIRDVLAQAGVRGADVAAVGLTGQMHGMVLLDAQNRVIRPCILWNDQRTARQCDEITATVGAERVLEITGNPVLTGFTAPKIVWTRENEPQNYARVAHVLLPKDYVRFCLSGEFFSDVSDASGTSLLNVRERRWSDEVLGALDIPRAWLPEVTESPVVSSHVSAAAAQATGLAPGTPIVGGAGDQAAAAVGNGIVREGLVSITLGTSGVVFAASQEYRVEAQGRLHAFCHAVPGMWHLMGVMLSAAGSLQWHHDTVAPDMSFDALVGEAAAAPAGAEGLLFLPYLTGERMPYPDPLARGAWVGLTVRHGRGHLTRAVLEGVAFGLKDGFGLMAGAGLPPIESVRVSGGGARSAVWRQILASVLGTPLATVNTTEGTALGAALLAGVGAGVWPDAATAAARTVLVIGEDAPDPDQAPVYEAQYPLYHGLYTALKPTFQGVAA
ncbi:MAG: xylulokinase [Anaerolineae bacterium]